MNRNVVVALVIVLVLVVLVFIGFVSPGYVHYGYKTMNLGMMGVQRIRTDRFTGKTEIYGAGKWQPIEINGGTVNVPAGTTIHVQ